MTTKGFFKTAGFFGLLAAAGLLFYWFGQLLMVLSQGSVPLESLLSGEAASVRLAVFSQHPWWRIVNAGQCVAILFGLFFTVTVMVSRRDKLPALGFLAGLANLAGYLVLAGTAFAEAVLWTPAAMTAPSLLDTAFGPIYSDRVFILTLLSGNIAFAAGSALFGLMILRKEGWGGAVLYSLGALLFGIGFLAIPFVWGVRTLGILLFATGLIIVSMNLMKKKGLLISAE
jgi:hypothetical protein